MGYRFDIQYQPDLENKVADALSRINPAVELMAIIVSKVLSLERLIEEVTADESLGKIVDDIEADWLSHPGYSLSHEQLLYNGRLVIPKECFGASTITRRP